MYWLRKEGILRAVSFQLANMEHRVRILNNVGWKHFSPRA